MPYERRIGIIGLGRSGKTVLLTSLISQLEAASAKHHFLPPTKAGPRLSGYRPINGSEWQPGAGWDLFPYADYRDGLAVRGKWPKKTADRFQFACRVTRHDFFYSNVQLNFFDLPGERLADAWMFTSTYAEWSDRTLETLAQNDHRGSDFAEFYTLLAEDSVDLDAALSTYIRCAIRHCINCSEYVTPSTISLTLDGQTLGDTQQRLAAENPDFKVAVQQYRTSGGDHAPESLDLIVKLLAENRFSGLSAYQQFVPLSEEMRHQHPELVIQFESHYNDYKAQILVPIIQSLRQCHSLVTTVDILSLLMRGHHAFNESCRMLEDLLAVVDPRETGLGRAIRQGWSVLGWPPAYPDRIAFAVPKLDLVHPSERDQHLELARKVIGPRTSKLSIQNQIFQVSAIASTRPHGIGRKLEGRLKDPKSGQTKFDTFEQPELPSGWPKNWNPGQWHFTEAAPVWPENRDFPADHIGLAPLADYVMQ